VPNSRTLRDDALHIWQAGVDAVDSKRLVLENVSIDGAELLVGPERIELDSIARILVVGAGTNDDVA